VAEQKQSSKTPKQRSGSIVVAEAQPARVAPRAKTRLTLSSLETLLLRALAQADCLDPLVGMDPLSQSQ
jgi:hypothetical protein